MCFCTTDYMVLKMIMGRRKKTLARSREMFSSVCVSTAKVNAALWPQWALWGSEDKMLQKPKVFETQSLNLTSSLCPTGTKHLQWWWGIAKEHFCVGKYICRLIWCLDSGSPALTACWTSFLPLCSSRQDVTLLHYTPCRSSSHSSGNIE